MSERKERINGRKAALAALLLLVTGLCLLPLGPKAAAADTDSALRPEFAVSGYWTYSKSSSNITSLAFSGMTAAAAPAGTDVVESGVTTGKSYTLATGYNKNAELHFIIISTSLSVPAHTKYTVRHNFDLSGTRTVSNKKATAPASFQLSYLGTSASLSGAAISPAVPSTSSAIAGLNQGTELIQGYKTGTGSATTADIGQSASKSGIYTYENTTDSTATISQFFGLWVCSQYGKTYTSSAQATCKITTEITYSAVRLALRKDDRTWTGASASLTINITKTYTLTETEPGVYTYPSCIFPLNGTEYKLSLDGETFTLAYDPETDPSPFSKAMELYTVTYNQGDATGLKNNMPSDDIVLSGTTYRPINYVCCTKPGYFQSGWGTQVGKGAVSSVVVTKRTTFYPSWAPEKYTVTLDPNGGTVKTTSISVRYANYYWDLVNPTREGYNFLGWYTEKEGGTQITSATFCSIPNDHTLYARWELIHKDHAICAGSSCFDSSHGVVEWTAWDGKETITYTNNIARVYLTESTEQTRSLTVSQGKTLYLCLNGQTLSYSTGMPSISVAADAQLILCDCSGGKTGKLLNSYKGGRAIVNKGTYTQYAGTVECSGTDTSDTPYTLSNEATANLHGGTIHCENGYGAYLFGSAKLNLSGGTVSSGKRYAVFLSGGGTVVMTGGRLQSSGSHGIYTALGSAVLKISGGTVSGSTYAIYNARPATKVYLSGSPSLLGASGSIYTGGSYSMIYAQSEEGAPYRGGTLLLCYSTVRTPQTLVYGVTSANRNSFRHPDSNYKLVLESGNLVLRGANECFVTFDPNGGSVTTTGKWVVRQSAYSTLPTPAFPGYRFAGWYTRQEGGARVESDTVVPTAEDHTLYAHWEPETVVSVEIVWGALEFTYRDGDWNPEAHAYENGGWVASQTAGDRITVENQGNVSVQVRLSYQSSYAAVSAEFMENGAAVAAPVSLGEGERKQMSVKLNGKPAGAMTRALLGTITIRIEEDSAL